MLHLKKPSTYRDVEPCNSLRIAFAITDSRLRSVEEQYMACWNELDRQRDNREISIKEWLVLANTATHTRCMRKKAIIRNNKVTWAHLRSL